MIRSLSIMITSVYIWHLGIIVDYIWAQWGSGASSISTKGLQESYNSTRAHFGVRQQEKHTTTEQHTHQVWDQAKGGSIVRGVEGQNLRKSTTGEGFKTGTSVPQSLNDVFPNDTFAEAASSTNQ